MKKYKLSLQANLGFTLIELILYISLTAIILLTISGFLSIILESRIKNQTLTDVNQEAMQLMNIITQTIRNSQDIIAPAPGISASTISLNVADSLKDPTIFDISSGAIRITEGGSPPLSLTSARIVASNLNFQNLSRSNTPGTIRISFTLTHINPDGRWEYEYSKTFYGSANLR